MSTTTRSLPMKKISEYVDMDLLLSSLIAALVFAVIFFSGQAKAAEVTGAGSSFVYPIISKWADAYKKETGNSINYQSIGSGAGIKQIQAKTVDFGASDMPMKPEDLEKGGLVQFPIINGGVVPVLHVGDIKANELKLDTKTLADLFLGNIKKWNDPAIAKLNPKVKLPDMDVTVVHRADGSGTTFIFTNYLSKVSEEWKSKAGEGTTVNWPVGVGAKGNEGVASNVQQIDGSIGYVEYAYALQNKMAYAQLQNAAGQFVSASAESFDAAAAGADWAKAQDYYLIMTNAAGKKSWPIAGSTFVIMHKSQVKPEQGTASLKFFKWSLERGAKMAEELHYIPLPKKLTSMVEKTWKERVKSEDGKPISVGL